jgi:hypothetical protein
MTCLLCPAVAVADSLCVPCGAKLWVSLRYENEYTETCDERSRIIQGRFDYHPALKERENAMRELDGKAAFQFGARYCHALQIWKAKKAERAAMEGVE